MTVRREMPSTSSCAASGVRSSSAWAARDIATESAHRGSGCQASELVALPNEASVPMLLEAMTEKGLNLQHTAATTGLRALALLLLPR